jgi:hypothetical protein
MVPKISDSKIYETTEVVVTAFFVKLGMSTEEADDIAKTYNALVFMNLPHEVTFKEVVDCLDSHQSWLLDILYGNSRFADLYDDNHDPKFDVNGLKQDIFAKIQVLYEA